MDQVLSLKTKTLKLYRKNEKNVLENSGNFVSPKKSEPCIVVKGEGSHWVGGLVGQADLTQTSLNRSMCGHMGTPLLP